MNEDRVKALNQNRQTLEQERGLTRIAGNNAYYYYKKKRFRWHNVKMTARTPYNAKTVTKRECDAKCEQSEI